MPQEHLHYLFDGLLQCQIFVSIRALVQAARDIQNKRFSNGEAKDIVYNPYMRVGEVGQFCNLQPEGGALSSSKCQRLMRSAT